jgi:transcriptional antiterminator RfaH
VAEALSKYGANFYVPLAGTVRTYGRRIKRFSVPLFPGYVFFCGGESDLELAWSTHRVVRVLYVDDQKRIRTELGHIYRVVASNQPVDLYPGLRRGRRCRVKCGPFRGVEGVVLRRRNAWRMYVAVAVLGQSAMIEIDAAVLEPID